MGCPAAILISPSLSPSLRWADCRGNSVAVILHEVLCISMYLPDSTHPLSVYAECVREVEDLIGNARHIGFQRIFLGGDLNVQLPEVHPHTGPQSFGVASSMSADVMEKVGFGLWTGLCSEHGLRVVNTWLDEPERQWWLTRAPLGQNRVRGTRIDYVLVSMEATSTSHVGRQRVLRSDHYPMHVKINTQGSFW